MKLAKFFLVLSSGVLADECVDKVPHCSALIATCQNEAAGLSAEVCASFCEICQETCGQCPAAPVAVVTSAPALPVAPANGPAVVVDNNMVVAADTPAKPALPVPKTSTEVKPNIVIMQDSKNGVFLQLEPQGQAQVQATPADIAPLPVMATLAPPAAPTQIVVLTQAPETTTRDEHGFTAEQLAQSVQANSLGNLPCERDQQNFLQTGKGFNPKCDENGDYFPVQCQVKVYNMSQTYRHCWCSDIRHGAKVAGSDEYIYSNDPEMDSKLQLLNRKCAPSITAQTIREQVKEENAEQGYQEASQVTVSIPPCQKKFEEIKKSNEEASARTTVYTRYHTVQPLPECTEDGFFKEMQCEASRCWCVDSSGEMIEGTKKYMFRNSAPPQCKKIERSPLEQVAAAKPDGPCWKQANIPGRKKLECDSFGQFREIQDDVNGRKQCFDANTGLRIETLEVIFDSSTMAYRCQVKTPPTTPTPPTTTLSPEQIAAQQKMIQQQFQEKIKEKTQALIQSKLQAMDPESREKMQQMANMMQPQGSTGLSSGFNSGSSSPYSGLSAGYQSGTMGNYNSMPSSTGGIMSYGTNTNRYPTSVSSVPSMLSNYILQKPIVQQYGSTGGSYVQSPSASATYGARPSTSKYYPNIQQASQVGNPWADIASYMGKK